MRYNQLMTNFVTFRDPLVLTAFHEAGHAVMAHLCGQIVTTVEIVGDDDHTGSVSSLRFTEEPRWGVDEKLPTAAIEARILCVIAGIASESIVSGDHGWREREDDLNEAVRLGLRVVESCDKVLPLLNEARDHAVDLLIRHWAGVEALAEMLLIHRRLSGDQMRRVIGACLDPDLVCPDRVA